MNNNNSLNSNSILKNKYIIVLLEDIEKILNNDKNSNITKSRAKYLATNSFKFNNFAFLLDNKIQELINEVLEDDLWDEKSIEIRLKRLHNYITSGKMLGVFSKLNAELKERIHNLKERMDLISIYDDINTYSIKLMRLADMINNDKIKYDITKITSKALIDFYIFSKEAFEE